MHIKFGYEKLNNLRFNKNMRINKNKLNDFYSKSLYYIMAL